MHGLNFNTGVNDPAFNGAQMNSQTPEWAGNASYSQEPVQFENASNSQAPVENNASYFQATVHNNNVCELEQVVDDYNYVPTTTSANEAYFQQSVFDTYEQDIFSDIESFDSVDAANGQFASASSADASSYFGHTAAATTGSIVPAAKSTAAASGYFGHTAAATTGQFVPAAVLTAAASGYFGRTVTSTATATGPFVPVAASSAAASGYFGHTAAAAKIPFVSASSTAAASGYFGRTSASAAAATSPFVHAASSSPAAGGYFGHKTASSATACAYFGHTSASTATATGPFVPAATAAGAASAVNNPYSTPAAAYGPAAPAVMRNKKRPREEGPRYRCDALGSRVANFLYGKSCILDRDRIGNAIEQILVEAKRLKSGVKIAMPTRYSNDVVPLAELVAGRYLQYARFCNTAVRDIPDSLPRHLYFGQISKHVTIKCHECVCVAFGKHVADKVYRMAQTTRDRTFGMIEYVLSPNYLVGESVIVLPELADQYQQQQQRQQYQQQQQRQQHQHQQNTSVLKAAFGVQE